MSYSSWASDIADVKVGNYGCIGIDLTLGSRKLSEVQLDSAARCVAAQLQTILAELAAQLEGTFPKSEGSTYYDFNVDDDDGEHMVEFSADLKLSFEIPRHVAYAYLSGCVDLIMPHIVEHFTDPDAELRIAKVREEVAEPQFQLACRVYAKQPGDLIAQRFAHCQQMMERTAHLTLPGELPGIDALLEAMKRVGSDTVEFDIGQVRPPESNPGIGQYL